MIPLQMISVRVPLVIVARELSGPLARWRSWVEISLICREICVTSALMGVCLGGLLVVATVMYAIHDCQKACSPGQQSSQQKR